MTPAIGDRITYRVKSEHRLVRGVDGLMHRDDGVRHGVVTAVKAGYVVVCSERYVTVALDAIEEVADARQVPRLRSLRLRAHG